MSEAVTVELTCDHRDGGESLQDAERSVLWSGVVSINSQPAGFDLRGRVLVDEQVLEGDSMTSKWRSLWAAANRTGKLPRVSHSLRCGICRREWRVDDRKMRAALIAIFAQSGHVSTDVRVIPLQSLT